MDEHTCKPLVTLFESQPCCLGAELKPGIEHWNCGGQPWHFNLASKDFDGFEVHHLGLRAFPQRQLTLESWAMSKVRITAGQDAVSNTPSLEVEPKNPANRLLLHGQPICAHTKTTPGFWRFLSKVQEELEGLFSEIVWVGTERDREIGMRTYPAWRDFDDGGDFLKLAELMAGSKAVIGVGSSVVALAGALKVPCLRVHDPIGEHPKQIWDNLGENQANQTEVELRKSWPEWRDRWIKSEVAVG